MTNPLSPGFSSTLMPWMTNNYRQLETALNTLAIQADFENRRWAQKWFESFQFLIGNQNFRWSREYDYAIDSDFLSRGGVTGPDAQTNMTRVVVEALASSLFAQIGDLVFETRYDASSRGNRLKKLLEGMGLTYNERLDLEDTFDLASIILAIYAIMYYKVDWSPLAGQRFKRPKQQVVQVPRMSTRKEQDPVTGEQVTGPYPVLGPDGQPEMMDSWQNVVGPDGRPIWEWATNGDVDVRAMTPFEVNRDRTTSFNRIKWIHGVEVMDYDEFLSMIERDPGVIEENVMKVRPGVVAQNMRGMAMRHFMRAMFSTPGTINFTGQMGSTSMMTLRNKVLVIDHHDRPTEGSKYLPTPWLKEGRRCVTANGRLVAVSTPKYRVLGKATGWHPYEEARWLGIPPSSLATGPVTDTIAKNREINLTDTLHSLAVQRTAGAHVLVNELSGLDKEKLDGEPGKAHYVTGDPNQAIAFVSDRNPVNPATVRYREIQKDDIYQVSAALESERGEKSTGETSGYHARIREERSRKRISKAENSFYRATAGVYIKIFACVQQNAARLDPDVVARIIRSCDAEVTEGDVMDFLNGPIDFGVDVRLKYGSMRLRSHATEIADIQEAMANPVIAQRLMQDPGVVDSYLDFIGVKALRDLGSVHRESARRENARFYDLVNVRDPAALQAYLPDLPTVLWEHDDMVHLIEHIRDFVKNEEKYRRNPLLMRLHKIHCAWHEQNLKAKQDEQSPYLATQAPMMVQNAEQIAAAPKNVIQELTEFKTRKAQEAAAMMQQRPAGERDQAKADEEPAPAKQKAPSAKEAKNKGPGGAPK